MVVSLLMGLGATAEAAPKGPFAGFKGKYNGTVNLVNSSVNTTAPATITVKTSGDGKSARVVIAATVVVSGTPVPVPNTLSFLSLATFTVADITNFTETQGAGAVGSYSGRKAISYSARFNVGGTTGSYSGKLLLRNVGKRKQELALTSILATDTSGVLFTFTFEASKKRSR